jgi:hypothetical protein
MVDMGHRSRFFNLFFCFLVFFDEQIVFYFGLSTYIVVGRTFLPFLEFSIRLKAYISHVSTFFCLSTGSSTCKGGS